MFYTVHCSIIIKENQRNARVLYILFQHLHVLVSIIFDHHQGACVTQYHNFTACAIVWDKIVYRYVI